LYFVLTATTLLNVGFGTHSKTALVRQVNMKVRIIPALSDNYMYLVRLNGVLFDFTV
jgi:hypothetical protein